MYTETIITEPSQPQPTTQQMNPNSNQSQQQQQQQQPLTTEITNPTITITTPQLSNPQTTTTTTTSTTTTVSAANPTSSSSTTTTIITQVKPETTLTQQTPSQIQQIQQIQQIPSFQSAIQSQIQSQSQVQSQGGLISMIQGGTIVPGSVMAQVPYGSKKGRKNVRENVLLIGPTSSYRQISGRMMLEHNPQRKIEEYPQVVVGAFRYRAKDALLKCPHGTGTLDRIFIKNDEVSILLPKDFDFIGSALSQSQSQTQSQTQSQAQSQQAQSQQSQLQAPQIQQIQLMPQNPAQNVPQNTQSADNSYIINSTHQQMHQIQQIQQQQHSRIMDNGSNNNNSSSSSNNELDSEKVNDHVWMIVKKTRNGKVRLWRRSLSEIRPHLDYSNGGYYEETHVFTEICKVSKEAKIGHSSGGKEVYCTKLKLSDTGYLWVEFNFYKIFNFAFENFKPVDIGYSALTFPRSSPQLQQQNTIQNMAQITNQNADIVGIVTSEQHQHQQHQQHQQEQQEQQQQQQEQQQEEEQEEQEEKEQIISISDGNQNGNGINVEVEEVEIDSNNNNNNNNNNGNGDDNGNNGQIKNAQYTGLPLPAIQDNNLLLYSQMDQVSSENLVEISSNGNAVAEVKAEGAKLGYNQEENDALRNLFLLSKNEPQKNEAPEPNGSTPPSDIKQ